MYMIFVYIILVVIFFYFGRKNYIKKANLLNKNIKEYIDDIVLKYNSLSEENKEKFNLSLTNVEKFYFTSILEDEFKFSSNINTIESYKFNLEEIMSKLKILISKENSI